MRQTLLQISQGILNAMESDEVNSIHDTTESFAVANVIRQCFYDFASEFDLPDHEGLFQLNASGDNTKPCVMFVPENVCNIKYIQYDNKDVNDERSRFKEVTFIPIDEYVLRTQGLAGDVGTEYQEMTVSSNEESFNFTIRNDVFPTYYTSFNDRTIVFDSFDSDYDVTLQKHKTLCYGKLYPTFTLEDDFYPQIDPTQFSYLINKAKTRAFYEFKQTVNEESSAEARKQKIKSQKSKRRIPIEQEIYRGPRYGRK